MMILTYLKILIYTTEFHFIRLWANLFNYPLTALPKYNYEQKRVLNDSVKKLLSDWKPISGRAYSFDDLDISRHLNSFVLVLNDLKSFLVRKFNNDSHDISKSLFDESCPDYFKRNYHYQTDGYFTKNSAFIYDHQIELLFMGTCHLMRKVSYSLLNIDRDSHFSCLEIGAGSGTSAKQFLNLYPLAKLDILDASEGYLKAAKSLYGDHFNDYICSFIESYQSTKKYDVIYICFTMHEIPVEIWPVVIERIRSLLSDNGHFLVVDAMQDGDRHDVQFTLDDFEQDYYEPYFAKYRKTQLETYIENCGFSLESKNDVLFSKALLFKKS